MDATLPTQSSHPVRRTLSLALARWLYRYRADDRAQNPLAPVAMAAWCPPTELYSPRWAFSYLPTFARVHRHVQRSLHAHEGHVPHEDRLAAAQSLFGQGTLAQSIEARAVREDRWFARTRIDGPNPALIRRADDRAEIAALFPGVVLPSNAELFVLDYSHLRRARASAAPSPGKHLPAPVALLAELDGALVTLAIRVEIDAPVRTPHDEHAWEHAKLCVQTADFNDQTLRTHLHDCHAMMVPFALSTPRQLAPEHPIRLLLAPHLQHTLMVNQAALSLFRTGAVFDTMYGGGLARTCAVFHDAHRALSFRDLALPNDLARRGVERAPVDYPFRDDALSWWTALGRYVRSYVDAFYLADADVRHDIELAAWTDELSDPRAGAIAGLLRGERLGDRQELAELLQLVLFIAGPRHASAHYPQTTYFTSVASSPGALYYPHEDPIGPDYLALSLPPRERAAEQFAVNHVAGYRHERFGDYAAHPLSRIDRARPAITRLRRDLDEIEAAIAARNAQRPRPYPYLLPSLVTNSVDI